MLSIVHAKYTSTTYVPTHATPENVYGFLEQIESIRPTKASLKESCMIILTNKAPYNREL